MVSIWSIIVLLIGVMNANRLPWVEPVPGARTAPLRPIVSIDEFGPDSPYRLLLSAGDLPETYDAVAVSDWTHRLREIPWPKMPPDPFGQGGLWDARTSAQVRRALDAVEPNLRLARRVAIMPGARVPSHVDPSAPLDEAPQRVRDLRRALTLSAYRKEGGGDYAGAFGELLTIIRLSNMLTRGGTTIHQSTAQVTTSIALIEIWRIAARNRIPSPLLRKVSRELLEVGRQADSPAEAIRNVLPHTLAWSDMHWDPKFVAKAWQMGTGQATSYCLKRLGFTYLAGGTPAGTRRNIVAFSGQLASWAAAPYRPETAKRLAWLKGQSNRKAYAAAWIRFRDPGGFEFAVSQAVLFPAVVQGHAERTALLRGTTLFLAVKAYENDTGRPPARLADLVPRYLEAVPKDPFDGKPFRYVTGKVPKLWGDVTWGTYSIASDFRDDGGKATAVGSVYHRPPVSPKHRKNPDIVWIPKPFP
ncbi:MAG: hypothetical protein HN904_07865 [Victivallales bacterium]|jgi:hypothetical protein|nr:hypothetical protein [Victivallales bacterium]MBT7162680.1 hypothetical protein [Victivallales bacterium]